MKKTTRFMTEAAVIAAIYVILTVAFAPFSFGEVQVRISEGLAVLPFFTPAAIPGLTIGCLLGNLLGGAIPVDVVFGSLATLIGAAIGYMLRKNKYLVVVPTIVSNTIIVPLVLFYGYGVNLPIPLMMVTVGIGEVISCGMIGFIFLTALEKRGQQLFGVYSKA
ncbi:MAG: QueT transporter family protein [Lachnospiraceae bacterium]|nr:QueT transporter family protein [Lachnospiraceae bacterium]